VRKGFLAEKTVQVIVDVMQNRFGLYRLRLRVGYCVSKAKKINDSLKRPFSFPFREINFQGFAEQAKFS